MQAQGTSSTDQLKTHLQRGQAALKANQQEEAAKEFRAALSLDPSNAEAHANLGALSFFHGDCKDAEIEFREALKSAPSLIGVLTVIVALFRTGITDWRSIFTAS